MVTIAKQIGTSLELSEQSRRYMEDAVGERLRAVAIAASKELDPHVGHVTKEQLRALSLKLGVDHITLLVRTENDIVGRKSSDPKEIGISTKTWDYWYKAFNQLFDLQYVDIPQGQKLRNFWSGPIQFSTSNPSQVDKWGYYYDGTTDYIINPYIHAEELLQFSDTHGTNALIRKLLDDNPDIVEITGFNSEFFGKPPIMKIKNGVLVRNLDVRDIEFGNYSYKDELDVANVERSSQTGQVFTTESMVGGKRVLKSFIPLSEGKKYVVGVSFDGNVIRQDLNRQLIIHCVISLGLVVAAWISSYFIAGFLIRPLNQIVRHVNEIAQGRFTRKITVRRHDELGLLSSRVNTMADSLQTYMGQLIDTAKELRGTKESLESFFNHTSDAIHVTDLEGRVIQVNKAFEKMYGWTAEETLHQPLMIIPEDKRGEFEEISVRILNGESVTDYETVRVTKAGQTIDTSITVSPIRSESGEIVAIAVISRDITARKQTEELIRRSEKLSVVGQLAAGVAHEIRNPLATIRGFVQLIQEQGALAQPYDKIMLSELDRINFIVSEFLVLAKPQAQNFESAELRSILDDIIVLLGSQAILHNVEIVPRFASSMPPLVCEVNQLKQVFLNVLKNALEAMPEGGKITIDLFEVPDENMVAARICDEGVGIPADLLPRLGEPFFTNKETGTGLGLMVSQRIIANHKGSMKIESAVGQGTCVEIRLPAAVIPRKEQAG
ncbi:PAS domain S-box protein [Cohnella pontilimi]|uniref:histidine kinase n=2 Tax=Cohnella pontilimi TaxID=2564100 RepID=A0A4V5LSE9_9BACL|nr:PAS domain S-box protein [Cohnella pontilimi]